MTVADILDQMAQNAGRARLQHGAILGDTIQGLASIPGQIMDDRAHRALVAQQQARLNAQDARQTRADARSEKDQALQDLAAKTALEHKAVVDAGLAAAMDGDPTQFNAQAAFDAVSKLGKPEAITDVIAKHREMAPKITYGAAGTMGRDEYGQVIPGSEIPEKPPAPSPAGFAATATDPSKTPAERAAAKAALDAVQQTPGAAETARHNVEMEKIGRLTAGRTAAAQAETARHNRAVEKSADPFGGGTPGGATGEDLLAKMPADQKAQAQALVDGRRSLDARLASTPYGRTIIAAAYAIDPTFDQGNYNARNKARTDLTSPNGTGGKTIGALNTAIQHAGTLSDLIEKLDNYETPLLNAVVNPIRSGLGKTEVTNYDTVAPQLAKEIERVWRGAGGTAGEIHDLIETIGHNKGKQQQREALAAFVDLARGKLDTLEKQRDTVMGAAGSSIPVLYKDNQPIVDRIGARAGRTPATDTSGAPAEGQAGSVNGVPAVWKTVNGKSGWYAK